MPDLYVLHVRASQPGDSFDDELLGGLLDELADWGGAVSGSGDEYSVTFDVPAVSVEDAVANGLEAFLLAVKTSGLPVWPIVHLEVMTETEHDELLAEPPIPRLVGVAELAEILEVSKQRASALAKSDRFPAPVQTLRSGPLWDYRAVRQFEGAWDRKPGRPKTAEVVDDNAARVHHVIGGIREAVEDTGGIGRPVRRILVEPEDFDPEGAPVKESEKPNRKPSARAP